MAIVTFPEVFDKRGLSALIWKDFPAYQILNLKDANIGYGVQLDVANPPTIAAATAATVTSTGGVRGFTDAASTVTGLTWADGGPGLRYLASVDNEAAEMQWCGGGEPFIISDTAADALELVFEAQFRVNTITAEDLGFFIGLAGRAALDGDFLANAVADKDAIADIDLIGLFHSQPDTTGVDINYQITGTAATAHEADWKTLVINTWYTFGMRYKPVQKRVDFYWGTGDRSTTDVAIDDNPIVAADIAAADFPDGQGLAPVIAIKGGHANDKWLDIRTMACAQLAKAPN